MAAEKLAVMSSCQQACARLERWIRGGARAAIRIWAGACDLQVRHGRRQKWRGFVRRQTVGLLICADAASLSAIASPVWLEAADVDALPSRPADVQESYGTAAQQFGELRLPMGRGPFPVAIILHGGCWIASYANVHNTAALADALRNAGVATWNIEYRRYGDPGAGWPGTFADVAMAADHLRTLAARYPLDLTRVISVGHSAGAHLALWLAARVKLPPESPLYRATPLPLRGVLALAGPGDLRDFSAYDRQVCGAPVVHWLLGGSPDRVAERYAQASPAALLPFGIPQVLIVGEADAIMPESSRQAYAAVARTAGDRVEVQVVPHAGHFELIAPGSTAWANVRDSLLPMLAVPAGDGR